MQGQPVGATPDLDEAVRHASGHQDPVPRAELDALPTDVEHGAAGQEGDPFVVVLEIVLGGDVGPAQDLLDHDVAEDDNLFNALAGDREVSPGPQRDSAWGERNGYS